MLKYFSLKRIMRDSRVGKKKKKKKKIINNAARND